MTQFLSSELLSEHRGAGVARVMVAPLLAAQVGCAPVPADGPRGAPPATSVKPVIAAVAGTSSVMTALSVHPTAMVDAGTPLPEASAAPAASPPALAFCPEGMAGIEGSYCTKLELKCLTRRKPWQCAEYDSPGVCSGKELAMRYCIDRYEHPNQKGALPLVMTSWNQAAKLCRSRGKRLCTGAEWTLACEGPKRLAFPYGFKRDATACPIDKRSPRVNESRLFASRSSAAEVARLDQREPSGSRPRCVSDYGVYDLTGNVDEWVVNESGRPYQSALKGGNWGEYRNACRPATRGHDERFYYYQTGFRCCRDPLPSAR